MIVAWPLVKAFLLNNWRLIAIGGIALALVVWHKVEVSRAWHAGRAALVAEQAAEAKRRNDNAQEADAAARRCAADPACRLQDDGHRRD